jgi:hypothetical protein
MPSVCKCVDVAKARQGDILYVINTGTGVQRQTGDEFGKAKLDDDAVTEQMLAIEEGLVRAEFPDEARRLVRKNQQKEISLHRLKRSDYFHERGLLTRREDMIIHCHPPAQFSNMQLLLRANGIVAMQGQYEVDWELDRISYSGDLNEFTNIGVEEQKKS